MSKTSFQNLQKSTTEPSLLPSTPRHCFYLSCFLCSKYSNSSTLSHPSHFPNILLLSLLSPEIPVGVSIGAKLTACTMFVISKKLSTNFFGWETRRYIPDSDIVLQPIGLSPSVILWPFFPFPHDALPSRRVRIWILHTSIASHTCSRWSLQL